MITTITTFSKWSNTLYSTHGNLACLICASLVILNLNLIWKAPRVRHQFWSCLHYLIKYYYYCYYKLPYQTCILPPHQYDRNLKCMLLFTFGVNPLVRVECSMLVARIAP